MYRRRRESRFSRLSFEKVDGYLSNEIIRIWCNSSVDQYRKYIECHADDELPFALEFWLGRPLETQEDVCAAVVAYHLKK